MTTRKITAPAWNVISPPQGAATVAPGWTAAAPTLNARIASSTATSTANVRRDSQPRIHDQRRASNHGMTISGMRPIRPQRTIVTAVAPLVGAPITPTPR